MFLFHTKKEHLIKTSSVWIKNPTIPTGTTSTNLYQSTRSMMTIDGHVEAAHTKKIVEGIKVSTKFKANPLGLVAKYGSLACLMCCAGVTLEHIDCFGTNKPVKNAHELSIKQRDLTLIKNWGTILKHQKTWVVSEQKYEVEMAKIKTKNFVSRYFYKLPTKEVYTELPIEEYKIIPTPDYKVSLLERATGGAKQPEIIPVISAADSQLFCTADYEQREILYQRSLVILGMKKY